MRVTLNKELGVDRYFTKGGVCISEHAEKRIGQRLGRIEDVDRIIDNIKAKEYKRTKQVRLAKTGTLVENVTWQYYDPITKLVFIFNRDKNLLITAKPAPNHSQNIKNSMKRGSSVPNGGCAKSNKEFKKRKEDYEREEFEDYIRQFGL